MMDTILLAGYQNGKCQAERILAEWNYKMIVLKLCHLLC